MTSKTAVQRPIPRAATCYRVRGASLSPQAQAYSVVTSLDTVTCSHKSSVKTTHPFNGPLSVTTQVSRYQKDKNNLDFTEARDSEWQWHQLGHMQICTSLQTNTNASTPPVVFYRPDALPAAQPTVSKHWRHQSRLIQRKYCLDLGLPVHRVMNDLRALKSPFD